MTTRSKLSLEALERQLDRTHQFYQRIDTKLSALFAISSGQIAVAALNLSPNDLKLWWTAISLVVFLLTIGWVMFNLYRCAYPHLEGGNASLVYFAEIAKLRESEYINRITSVIEDDHKTDISGQIWRNSEIVCCKYRHLKQATIAAMLSLIPWVSLLVGASLSNSRIPVVSG